MNKVIETNNVPVAVCAYSQALEVNGNLYISGQRPMYPKSGNIVEGGIKEQTKTVLDNAESILEAKGDILSDVVKSNSLLSGLVNINAFNDVYSTFYNEKLSASSCTYAIKDLQFGVLVEIDTMSSKIIKNEW